MSATVSGEAEEENKTSSPPPAAEEREVENPEASRKRSREPEPASGDPRPDPDGELQSPPKRRAEPHDVMFRIVVPSRQIGRVIGKEGSQIQRIREESRAAIKIADAIARHEERVIIISSRDEDSGISNAESALYSIARVILKDSDSSVEALNTSAGHVAANTIRLLITGSQAGCLIGISGKTIGEIRSLSGATVVVLAQNQLPSCASAHESDRVVQISGNISEVLIALERIGCKLRENPPRKVISIRPRCNYSSASLNPSSQLPVTPSSAEDVTSEMMIMEKLVGGLIGKNGSNISKIRNESGATIKVSGVRGGTEQRPIYFKGSAHQVALARMLVENYIYSQLPPQSYS